MESVIEIPRLAVALCWKIKEDHTDSQYFAYYLEYLCMHMPEKFLVPSLKWLIKNRLTGYRFVQFIQADCQRSSLEMVRQLTMRVEGEKKLRRLHRKDIR